MGGKSLKNELGKFSNLKLHMPMGGYKLKLGVSRSKRFVRGVWES